VRRALLLTFAAVLGASAVVLPAVASSEATITAYSYGEKNYWVPTTAPINAGGAVTFTNPSGEVQHGVEWRPGNPATPSCDAKVPVGTTPAASGKNWSGACTFSQPGKYEFWCTVHGKEMSGTISVAPASTTPSTTTSTSSNPPAGGPGSGAGQGGPSSPSTASGSGSPLAGSASSALKIASSQRGATVRGSVDISPAGEGGGLEVDALAKSAALASSGQGGRVRVGKLVLSHLHAGKVSFSVALNRRARAALRRHRRLALSIRATVSPPGGSPLTITRSVLLRG
jgi:plastocyanin